MAASKKSKFEIAIIDLVREKRLEENISQDTIALFINTTRSYVAHVESHTSHQKYNLKHLNLIATGIGCSPKDFMPETAIPEKEELPASNKKANKKKAS